MVFLFFLLFFEKVCQVFAIAIVYRGKINQKTQLYDKQLTRSRLG